VVGVVGDGIVGDEPAIDHNEGGGVALSPFITSGQPDNGHRSVGSLKSGGSACTATLVGKRTVLTAGHCVKGPSAEFKLDGQTYHSSQIIKHPGYGGGNNNDIAVVILQQAPQGVSPSPVMVSAPHVGQHITLVGYGRTSEQGNDYGTKRMGTNTISQLGSTTFKFQGGSNVCNGDSGGPTFVNLGGQEVVAGVHSTKNGYCGSGGTDMRVDSYLGWITQSAQNDVVKVQAGGGAPPPSSGGGAIAQEGEGCWKRTCLQGLVCVSIYNGPSVIGKFCLERCATLGKDPNCDGGETCTKSLDKGKVCFNPANPVGGFTSNGPGSKDKGQGGGGQNPGPQGACGNQQESEVFRLLNQVRAQNGMGAVKCDLKASAVARAHSQDMCTRGYFSHTSQDGRSHSARLKAGGVQFSSSGENIAWGYQGPQKVHQGWMNSSGHRQNMLTPSWTRVGIGQVNCGGKPYWTEVFMR
jgi:uncharacterized protein YkwD